MNGRIAECGMELVAGMMILFCNWLWFGVLGYYLFRHFEFDIDFNEVR